MSANDRLADLAVGDELTELEKEITHAQLFRYSAITWNAHRIHYDPEYARSEGHPNALVQQHFHGAVVQQRVMDWLGDDGALESLEWRNVGRAVPGKTLYAGAEVTDVDREDGRVEFDVWTRTDEERCAEGTITVVLD